VHCPHVQGLRDEALEVSSDPDHKFDLAIGLNKLNVALELAQNSEHDVKWKTLADAALKAHAFALAETAMLKAHDCAGLLLLYTSLGNTGACRAFALRVRVHV
jgi:coatomer subunit beta'